MSGPRYTPLAATLPETVPFVGPEAQERARGRAFAARMGANENAFGPSPRAIAAMQRAAGEAWMYGDPENHDLRVALARRHGAAPENIVVGEGIDGLLGYLVRLMVAQGDAVVTSDGAYPTFNFHVAGYGGVLQRVPYRADHEDPAALLDRAAAVGAKLVYLANPDNPMGSWHGARVVEEMVAAVPEGCLLVLDEAYADFLEPEDVPRIAPDDPRVIRLRTFSKAHGLAGLRVGYAICAAPLARAFDKVRNHFGMGRVAQAAALAALEDGDWLDQTRAAIAASRADLARIAAENGLSALPSATNFIAIDCHSDGSFAAKMLQELTKRDIFVRKPIVAPLDRCIRVSCGTPAMNARFAAALPEALAAARASS